MGQIYRTDDGREFNTEWEAKNHADRLARERGGSSRYSGGSSSGIGALILIGAVLFVLSKVAEFFKANSAVIGTCVFVCVICVILCLIFHKKIKSKIPILITILISIGLFIGTIMLGQNDLKRLYANVGEKLEPFKPLFEPITRIGLFPILIIIMITFVVIRTIIKKKRNNDLANNTEGNRS